MSEFRLIKIYELPEELIGGANRYLAVDVPDPLSVTGYTTRRISASTIAGLNIQSLEDVLAVGNHTGTNGIRVDELSGIGFEKGTFYAYLKSPVSLSSDIFVNMPEEDGKLSLELSTAWKSVPIYNGSFGVPNTGNVAFRPKIMIKNRTVFFSGLYLIPMTTLSGGTVLDTVGTSYPTNYFSDTYLGAGDGFELTLKSELISRSPILPSALIPSETFVFGDNRILNRTVNLNGRTRLTSIAPSLGILSDGRVFINSTEASERNGLTGSGFTKSAQSRVIVDRFNNGDNMESFDSWRNSHSSSFTVNNRILTDTGVLWNFDHDGTKAENLGGFIFRTDFSYSLDPSISLEQIETAFNSF